MKVRPAAEQRDVPTAGVVNVPREPGVSAPIELAVTALPEGGVVLLSRDLTERRAAEENALRLAA